MRSAPSRSRCTRICRSVRSAASSAAVTWSSPSAATCPRSTSTRCSERSICWRRRSLIAAACRRCTGAVARRRSIRRTISSGCSVPSPSASSSPPTPSSGSRSILASPRRARSRRCGSSASIGSRWACRTSRPRCSARCIASRATNGRAPWWSRRGPRVSARSTST